MAFLDNLKKVIRKEQLQKQEAERRRAIHKALVKKALMFTKRAALTTTTAAAPTAAAPNTVPAPDVEEVEQQRVDYGTLMKRAIVSSGDDVRETKLPKEDDDSVDDDEELDPSDSSSSSSSNSSESSEESSSEESSSEEKPRIDLLSTVLKNGKYLGEPFVLQNDPLQNILRDHVVGKIVQKFPTSLCSFKNSEGGGFTQYLSMEPIYPCFQSSQTLIATLMKQKQYNTPDYGPYTKDGRWYMKGHNDSFNLPFWTEKFLHGASLSYVVEKDFGIYHNGYLTKSSFDRDRLDVAVNLIEKWVFDNLNDNVSEQDFKLLFKKHAGMGVDDFKRAFLESMWKNMSTGTELWDHDYHEIRKYADAPTKYLVDMMKMCTHIDHLKFDFDVFGAEGYKCSFKTYSSPLHPWLKPIGLFLSKYYFENPTFETTTVRPLPPSPFLKQIMDNQPLCFEMDEFLLKPLEKRVMSLIGYFFGQSGDQLLNETLPRKNTPEEMKKALEQMGIAQYGIQSLKVQCSKENYTNEANITTRAYKYKIEFFMNA